MAESSNQTSVEAAEQFKELGNQAFAEKRFLEAAELYTKAIQKDPTNHVYFSNRSAAHAGMQSWEESIQDAKECIRLDPTFLKGYYRLATALCECKEYTSALATIRQGLNMDTNHPQLLKLLKIVQQQQQQQEVGEGYRGQLRDNANSETEAHSLAPNTASPIILDDASRKELEDLQIQYTRMVREHGTLQAHWQAAKRQGTVADLTRQEITGIPENAKCYRSVGKAFLRAWDNKSQVEEYLEKERADLAKQETEYLQKLEYLERRIKSQRQNMEELIASAKTSHEMKTSE